MLKVKKDLSRMIEFHLVKVVIQKILGQLVLDQELQKELEMDLPLFGMLLLLNS